MSREGREEGRSEEGCNLEEGRRRTIFLDCREAERVSSNGYGEEERDGKTYRTSGGRSAPSRPTSQRPSGGNEANGRKDQNRKRRKTTRKGGLTPPPITTILYSGLYSRQGGRRGERGSATHFHTGRDLQTMGSRARGGSDVAAGGCRALPQSVGCRPLDRRRVEYRARRFNLPLPAPDAPSPWRHTFELASSQLAPVQPLPAVSHLGVQFEGNEVLEGEKWGRRD